MEIFREDRVVFEHFEMREFSGSHRGDALYQGQTLVGPPRPKKIWAFSPWVFLGSVKVAGAEQSA